MGQYEFIREIKTRILHQNIETIKNAVIQWGINEFGADVFHQHPNTSEHEMTWYIAGAHFRHVVFGVVLMWGDVDDDIEIRFINNECDVSEGMVNISPTTVVKMIGIDQYMEPRKSLAKIVSKALKKENEDSKMDNKELISINDLYDLVNTQYRRFLDEDRRHLLSKGITGDIRIERTSGNNDSNAFEEIRINLHKPNPDNSETIRLIKFRTIDHWCCCVDKPDNIFCNIYKDKVEREGYICELFANPLVQYIITTVEEAVGRPIREVLDNSIDESCISDEMITTSLGVAKVSDYVTNLTGINAEDIYMATDEKKEKYNKMPIKDVQFNTKKKTTTVIFGEKTDPDKKKKKGSEEDKKSEDIIVVSNCSPKDKFDPEVGLAMCIAKAYFGNRSKFKKAVTEWTTISEARDKKKADNEKKKKAKQKKTKSTTTTKKKTGTRPGRPKKTKSTATTIAETEIVDNKPNEIKVDDNTDNIIG